MNFSAGNLLAGFIFSIVGLWVFREGKKQTNLRLVVLGLLLMLYSVFTPTTLWTWIVGCALSGLVVRIWND